MASDSSTNTNYDSAAELNPNTPIHHHDSAAIDDHLSSLTLTPLNHHDDEPPSTHAQNFLDPTNSGLAWADGPASPSSSGYDGERGSSGASSASAVGGGTHEIREDDDDDDGDNGLVAPNGISSSSDWVPGKRHENEDDASVSWRKRKKHFFILSNSGKPIYSRSPLFSLYFLTPLPHLLHSLLTLYVIDCQVW